MRAVSLWFSFLLCVVATHPAAAQNGIGIVTDWDAIQGEYDRLIAAGDFDAAAALEDQNSHAQISFGGSGGMALGEGQPTREGKYYNTVRFEARAGQVARIDMESDEFDSYLRVTPLGDLDTTLAFDDDGGEVFDSRLHFRVPADGQYVIVATTVFAGAVGNYTLSLSEGAGSAPSATAEDRAGETENFLSSAIGRALANSSRLDDPADEPRIAFGETVRGQMTSERGVYFYRFTVEQGDRIRITLRSPVFDTYLELFSRSIVNGEMVAANDDSDGTDSMVEYTVPSSGDYVIRAGSYMDEGRGAYTLELTRR